jgi:uncharacterized protein YbjT (DUF2867 family)
MNDPSNEKIRAIITGSTGMVGEGVLHVCLQNPAVEKVLIINRKPLGITHPKLTEIIHEDFFNLSPIKGQLAGYNACFFCLGVSSIGMGEPQYFRVTYTLTMHVAETLSRINNDMTFLYISGAGTDSTEEGRSMWARVKGKTENDLMKLPFKAAYAVRPGFIRAIKGLKHTHSFYKYIGWMFPAGRSLYSKGFCTMEELALCMIRVAQKGYDKKVLEGNDIIKIARE